MKKLFLTVALLSLCSLCAFGQSLPWEGKSGKAKGETQNQCVKKNVFGLDLGIGAGNCPSRNYQTIREYDGRISYEKYDVASGAAAFTVAPRFTSHFTPYIGADFIKINGTFGLIGKGENYYNIQFLTGIRGCSPAFYKCLSVYATFRMGYGIGSAKFSHEYIDYSIPNFTPNDVAFTYRKRPVNGFCLETELGFNITQTFFVGCSYNFQMFQRFHHIDEFTNGEKWLGDFAANKMHTVALRVGFNFGK